MKIMILGAGGIGGYFGGLLARAGHEVLLVDTWQEHVDAINRDGLRVVGQEEFTVRCRATTQPNAAEWPATDFLIVAVKNKDTAAALAGVKGMEIRCAATLQNGLEVEPPLLDAFGAERVVGLISHTSGSLIGPGLVRGFANDRPTFLGELEGEPTARIAALRTAFAQTPLILHVAADFNVVIWCKMLAWIPLVTVPAITRLTFGEAYSQRDAAHLYTLIERECAAVATALGHPPRDLPGFPVARRLSLTLDEAIDDVLAMGRTFIANGMAGYQAAMLIDLQNRRRTEIDYTAGVVVRHAHRLGLPVPNIEFVWRAIRAIEGSFAATNPPA